MTMKRQLQRTLLGALVLIASVPSVTIAQAPQHIMSWGTEGAGPGQFTGPMGIGVDPVGNVYVADFGNSRVQKFTRDGVYIREWPTGMSYPMSVEADAAGGVYVSSAWTPVIEKYSADGAFITRWGREGPGGGALGGPCDVAIDVSGNVHVADAVNNLVQVFTGEGAFVTEWGHGDGVTGCVLESPTAIAFDRMGNAYVGVGLDVMDIEKRASDGTCIERWASSGGLLGVAGIGTDEAGNVFVSDTETYLHMYSSSGALIARWGALGSGPGEFNHPHGVAVGPTGELYVVDSGNNRVQVFGMRPTPASAKSWGQLKSMYR